MGGPPGLISCPRRLALGPLHELLRGQLADSCDHGPRPKAHGVDQQSRENRARLRGPAGSTSSPGSIGPGPLGPWFRPALPGDSGQGLSACRVNQLSHVTWARVRGPAESTSCPGGLGPLSMGPQCQPAAPGDSGTCPRAAVSSSCPGRRMLGPGCGVPGGRPALLGDSGLGLKSRGFDQLYRVTRDQVRGAAGSTSYPGRIMIFSEGPQVDQLSQMTRAHVRVPEVSTSCPG